MSGPRSTTLFHFTKTLDVLKSILQKTCFHPHYCLEDVGWFERNATEATKLVAFPVVCFCDIPLSRITEHVDFYGQFGIGMRQEWGVANGLNPIIYVSQDSHLADTLRLCWNTATEATSTHADPSHESNARRLFGYCKPLTGQINIHEKPVRKEFYQESEWRYLAAKPEVPAYLDSDEFRDQNKRDKANWLVARICPLRFTPQDVKYLFVKTESDIPALVNFINVEMGAFPQKDVQILITRIVSLETIRNDL